MRTLGALLRKEARVIVRAPGVAAAVLLFAVVASALAAFGSRELGLDAGELRGLAAPLLLLTFFFSGVQGLAHTHRAEEETRALQLALLTPVDPALLYLSKLVSNFVFLVVIETAALLLFAIFLDLPASVLVPAELILTVAVLGFAAVGTVLGGVAAVTGGSAVLLPLLLFPVTLPVFLGCTALLRELFISNGVTLDNPWFVLLLVFDIVSLSLGAALYEQIGRE